MERTAAKTLDERPPCLGNPSIIVRKCADCVCREACYRRFSKRVGITVLSRPRRSRAAATQAADRSDSLATAAGKLGIDFENWVLLRHVFSIYNLSLLPRRKSQWRGIVKIKNSNRIVAGVLRCDTRRIVIDFVYADESILRKHRARQVSVKGKRVWRLELDTENLGAVNAALEKVLRESLLRNAFRARRRREQ